MKKKLNMPAAPANAVGPVEVTICEPHTHNGVDMQPGDIIAVPAPIADFLVEAGAAKHL